MARRGPWKPYGTTVEVDIDDAGPSGEGIGSLDGARYRIWTALPGERVRARIFGRKAGWRHAALEEVLRPSPLRVPARCPVFGQCGGCAWQNLAYGAQLELLEQRVRGLLADAGVALEASAWAPTLGSDEVFSYRGKIELTFGGDPGALKLGFNRRGRYWEVVDLEACHIGPPVNGELIRRIKAWAESRGHAAYRQRSHEGFLRYLVVRQQHTVTPMRWLAALVTTSPPSDDWGAADLVAAVADIEPAGSLLWVRSDATSQAVRVEACETLLGDGRLVERLGDVEYVLGLESFFQANARMAERLVAIVRERALQGSHDTVLDLFCGVGTMALALADVCRSVTGVEFVAPAVLDAENNARAHGWTHARFQQGAAEKYEWADDVDLLVLDPPRSGLHPRLPRRLLERPLPRVIYVSCNPQALATDLAQLAPLYEVVFIQCIDMFPHTPHVETVVELRRRNQDSQAGVRE